MAIRGCNEAVVACLWQWRMKFYLGTGAPTRAHTCTYLEFPRKSTLLGQIRPVWRGVTYVTRKDALRHCFCDLTGPSCTRYGNGVPIQRINGKPGVSVKDRFTFYMTLPLIIIQS
jgi:hypothetical protein